jgi:RimK family alpha-L-glutamate ligase
VVTENLDLALAAFAELGGDVIIKPLFGSEGRGMVRVSDEDTARRVSLALDLGRYVYYVQQFVPHGNEDIRVFVIGHEVTGAMIRHAGGWKTNVAQGAAAVPLSPDTALCDLALRAARAVGADYAGVDVLVGPSGYTVIEVNGIPGWQGLQSVTQFNIADSIVDYALAQTETQSTARRERA